VADYFCATMYFMCFRARLRRCVCQCFEWRVLSATHGHWGQLWQSKSEVRHTHTHTHTYRGRERHTDRQADRQTHRGLLSRWYVSE